MALYIKVFVPFEGGTGAVERRKNVKKKTTLILVFEVLSEFTAKSKVLIVPKWKWTFFSNF